MDPPQCEDGRLSEQADHFNRLISRRFSGLPTKKEVTMDLLHTIRRMKARLRWHYYFKFGDGSINADDRTQEVTENPETDDDCDEEAKPFEVNDHGEFRGFDTQLKADGVTNCPFLADPKTEAFLHDLDYTLQAAIPDKEPREILKISDNDELLDQMLNQLRNRPDLAMIATEKTNKHLIIKVSDYNHMMAYHVRKNCVEVSEEKVREFYHEATEFAASLSGVISKNERKYLDASLSGKFIPNGKLLLKDHKSAKKRYDPTFEFYDSRFIVPTGNFLSAFSRLGYTCIERLFKRNNVKFSGSTIRNSDALIKDLSKLNLNESNCTITSFDIVSMYPNCKLGYIEKALEHYSKDFSNEDKQTMENAWKVAQFGMKRTLLRSRGAYYLFKGESGEGEGDGEQGLSIGGYESAFFADLTVGFLFEMLKDFIERECVYGKIYRDDSLIVMRRVMTSEEIDEWKEGFCARVREIMPCMVFTVAKWDNGLNFLDLSFTFDDQGELTWETFCKPNAITKYLNSDSPGHTPMCKKQITTGVIRRLARLTKPRPALHKAKVLDYYPDHKKALEIANLCVESNSRHQITFGALWHQDEMSGNSKVPENNEKTKFRKKKKDKRVIHFVYTYSGRFLNGKPIHKLIQDLRNKHGLLWLRFRMSAKRFSSTEDKLNADLQGKVDQDVTSNTFLDFPCNCTKPTLVDGKCMFNGRCRAVCVIYGLECKETGKTYIGSTQRSVKQRTSEHCGDAVAYAKAEKRTDSFGEYFGERLLESGLEVNRKSVRLLFKARILWQGRNFLTAKKFTSDKCRLCAEERYRIFQGRRSERGVLNQNGELFGKCRHRSRIQKINAEETAVG